MSKVIDVKLALRVFEKITSKGIKDGYEYTLDGLVAAQSYDGYTASIYNDYVRLDLLFHNKIKFSADNARQRELFLDKLKKLGKSDI